MAYLYPCHERSLVNCVVAQALSAVPAVQDLTAEEAGLLPFWGADNVNVRLPRLFILGEALPPARETLRPRRLRLTASTPGGLSTSAEVRVAIEASAEALRLRGPHGEVPMSRPLEFDALLIRHRDSVAPAVANFTCHHLPDFGPCAGKDGQAPLRSGSSFLLPAGTRRAPSLPCPSLSIPAPPPYYLFLCLILLRPLRHLP